MRCCTPEGMDIFQRKRLAILNLEVFNNAPSPKVNVSNVNITEDTLNHGKKFEPTARQIYITVMKFKLQYNLSVREAGIAIQS